MDTREYCRFYLHQHMVRFYTPDGGVQVESDDETTTIYRLGIDGWECFSHLVWVADSQEHETMTFKRRKL